MYLIGGYSDNVGDRSSIFYAKIDDNNNIVDPESGTAILSLDTDDWIESTNTLNNGRRRKLGLWLQWSYLRSWWL